MCITGEMSEISGQTTLAIVEKRPQRPGGCAGILFQVFDWNRKFAKKKLFSKKLLPPVRLRKSSKKFGVDEKLPKLRLIADENSGGFPYMKKNEGCCNGDTAQKNEMRAPGLVARLMGLESMPDVKQDKSKKTLLSGSGSDKEEYVHSHGRFEREELIAEKGETKQEFRPQKLQKTGLSERKPVTKFGAEALQIKHMLSRSRKHHQKLVSPVKSPRNVSGRNASRFIGAATRILEPGLQRSKSKCALAYSNAIDHPPTADAFLVEANDVESFQDARCFQTSAKPLNGQSSSCTNCGHSLGGMSTAEQQPALSSGSQFVHPPCQMSERESGRLAIFCPELEKGKTEEGSLLYAAAAMEGRQPCANYMPEIKLLKKAGQRLWQAASPQGKLQKDVSPACLRHKMQGQDQMFQVRNRLPSRSKLIRVQSNRVSAAANATNETTNLVLQKQNISNHSHLRMSPKQDIYRLDTDQRFGDRGHDSLSPLQKRRSLNSSRQNEGSRFVSSTLVKPTNIRSSAISGKGRSSTSHSTIGPCTSIRLAHLQGSINADSSQNDSDVISFTFKSPMKRKTGIHADMEGKRNQSGPNSEVTLRKLSLNENEGKRNSLKSFPLSGDSLGVLLEQKLKELTCQEEDSAFGDTAPRKTTAVILQELISALTTERPSHWDQLVYGVNNRDSYLRSDNQQLDDKTFAAFQAKPKSTKISVGYLPNGEHLSPGSVLDVSFSNDSFASSSLDDGSRCNLGMESTEYYEGQRQLETDADLLDSACSLSIGKFYRESVINLLNNISEVFSTINLADGHLKGRKLTHAKEVILNAELVFVNAALPDAVVNGGFSISHFVLNELELLASVMRTNFSGFVAFDINNKEGNQLKGFVFDCVIEYLESRFGRYSNSGFNAWTRLPLRMKTEMLMCEIVEEVGRWAGLAGLMVDELIEHEMSRSFGKWTDFELEAFETGTEIDQQILQSLITEVAVDFICSSASEGC